MKKFLFFFLFLVILAGAVFYFGWAQFAVPPGSYGVMRSKTHGVDPVVLREGEFRWYWYRLIPTNAEISVFTPKIVTRAINSSGSLPSGDIYASIAGINADFSWVISGEYSFIIKPESLPSLCRQENIKTEDDLKALENEYSRRMETMILNRLINLSRDEGILETILVSGSMPDLNREIEAAFPDLEKISIVLKTIRCPDYDLYGQVRSIYNEYLAYQHEFLSGIAAGKAESVIGSRIKFDELEKIGEILSRYPVLLQYLAMERNMELPLLFGE